MMTFFYCRGRTCDVTRFALRCYLCLKVEEGHVLVKLLSFFSKSLSNPQAHNSTVLQLLLLMLSPAHYSCNSTRCAIYSAHRRFCFHHNQNRILHALPPASIRNRTDVIMCSSIHRISLTHAPVKSASCYPLVSSCL